MSTSRVAAGQQVAGHVRQVRRFPVKSMAGEVLREAELSWHGIAGDRRWAFVRSDTEANGFPWHTIRENPPMCLHRATLRDPDRPDASTVDVHTSAGDHYDVTDPLLAAELGVDLRLMRLRRGLFDSMPISLITTGTVTELCDRAGVPADPRRFRPNLFIETGPNGQPFVEDDWVGSIIRIGSTTLRVDRRDSRCIIVNVDPDSGIANPAVLKTVGQVHNACAGVYASIVEPGRVSADDKVIIV